MFISILLGGAAAFSALAIAFVLVPPRAPVELAAATDFGAPRRVGSAEEFGTKSLRHVLVCPTFAELVFAALAARVLRWRILVVSSRASFGRALTEAQTHARAPLEILEAVFPGVEWRPSAYVTSTALRVHTADATFALPAPRRQYIGAMLNHVGGDRRGVALARLREAAAGENGIDGIPSFGARLLRCARARCGAREPPAWARLAIDAHRRAAFDAHAPTETMGRAFAAAIRAAGGDVVVTESPPRMSTSPSMALPKRGSLLSAPSLGEGGARAIVETDAGACAMFVRRGTVSRDGETHALYVSEQPRKRASRALAWATDGVVHSTTHPRVEDAIRAVCERAMGRPQALRPIAWSEAFLAEEAVLPTQSKKTFNY